MNVLLARETTTRVLRAVMIAKSVLSTQRLPWLDRLNAPHAVQVAHQAMEVFPVRPARRDDSSINLMRASNVQQDTNRKLKTQKVAPNVELATKVNSVQMDPACVFFAMLVNFNPDPVHANSVQPVRMPVIKA